MSIEAGRKARGFQRTLGGLAVLLLALAFLVPTSVSASAETKVLRLYNVHTKERGEFAFKRNGRFVGSELQRINQFLRDWRRNEPTKMNPLLIDLVHEAYRQVGASGYINVVSAYRSPQTNSMLRSRSAGVAKQSQHTLGNAMDFFIPGVSLKRLREVGLRMEVGGVGYYPTSGSPFVHFDVGNARHWPRMSRRELAAVFPNGRTVHVPSDGKPLPGYQEALASYQKRKSSNQIAVASASSSSNGGGRTLMSMLFGGGADQDEDDAEVRNAPQVASRPQVDVAANARARAASDEFDTSGRSPSSAVAALDPSRIPIPSFRPVDSLPASASALASVSAPASAQAPTPAPVPAEVLVAVASELEEQAADPATATQLAYAVPTPQPRPVFESVLGAERVVALAPEGAPPSSEAGQALAALTTPAASGGINVVPAPRPELASGTKSLVEVPAAAPAPESPASVPRSEALPTLVASRGEEPTLLAPPSADAPRQENAAGKGGRVLNAATPKPRSRRVDPDRAIADRFLVAEAAPSDRTIEARRPETRTLLEGATPGSIYANAFVAGEAAPASNGFSGSAINFMPIIRTAP